MKRKLLTIFICCLAALTLAFGLVSCEDDKETENTESTESGETDKKSVCELNGHTPNADDGDCTTATKCVTCEKVLVEAKEHTAIDDGNCMTELKCTECGKVVKQGADEHNDTDEDFECDNEGCQITLDGAPKDENEGIDFPIVPN